MPFNLPPPDVPPISPPPPSVMPGGAFGANVNWDYVPDDGRVDAWTLGSGGPGFGGGPAGGPQVDLNPNYGGPAPNPSGINSDYDPYNIGGTGPASAYGGYNPHAGENYPAPGTGDPNNRGGLLRYLRYVNPLAAIAAYGRDAVGRMLQRNRTLQSAMGPNGRPSGPGGGHGGPAGAVVSTYAGPGTHFDYASGHYVADNNDTGAQFNSRYASAMEMARQSFGGAPNNPGNTGDAGHNRFNNFNTGGRTHGAIDPESGLLTAVQNTPEWLAAWRARQNYAGTAPGYGGPAVGALLNHNPASAGVRSPYAYSDPNPGVGPAGGDPIWPPPDYGGGDAHLDSGPAGAWGTGGPLIMPDPMPPIWQSQPAPLTMPPTVQPGARRGGAGVGNTVPYQLPSWLSAGGAGR